MCDNKKYPDIYNGKCDADENCKRLGKDWACAAHYSQIVWKDTKQVGCGRAKGIVVCQYSPAGNSDGQTAY